MVPSATLVKGAAVVDAGRSQAADVLMAGGRIARVDRDIPAPAGAEVVEADGLVLLPGMIDDQAHFREPGLEHKGRIRSESRAAVAGGITSYMEMPNTRPPTLDMARVEEKRAIAARDSHANYAFYLGASPDNAAEIARADPARIAGVKVFMGSSTGSLLVDREEDLRRVFSAAPTLVAVHSEDDAIIARNLARARASGTDPDASSHPAIRSREACVESTRRALRLARETGARLHVLHLTTREEPALLEPGPLAGKRVTAEACVHHLFFDDRDYGRLGNRIKCNPAIKGADDRAALLAALADGRIDVVATDHAPHTLAEKSLPYLEAPAGLPLAQHALPILLELVARGELTLPQVALRAAHAPAELFGVRDRGHIREGHWADVVLADPSGGTEVTRGSLLYGCGWSPLEGFRFSAAVRAVWVNGHKAFADGAVLDAPPGMALEFAR